MLLWCAPFLDDPLQIVIKADAAGIDVVLTGSAGIYVELRKAALTGFLQALRDPLTDMEIEDELRVRWLPDDDGISCHIILLNPITEIDTTWFIARRTGQQVAKQVQDQMKVRKRR